MKSINLSTLLLACASTILVGCNSDLPNTDEIVTEVSDEHQDDELSKGRLAIADTDQAIVHIFDLESNSLLESVNITNPAEYLYASPENRYAVAVQRSLNTVEFIDGGVWQELHDDHYDQHEDTPTLSSFSLHDTKPTHFVPRGDKTAIFFDGDSDTGANASLALLSDDSITAGSTIAEYDFDTYIHGTAEIRDDYVLTTIRDIDSDSSLPTQISLLELHDDHFHQEQIFETTCPSLHGSFQNETHIAFACSDGILSIQQEGSSFTAQKIDNPTDMPTGVRIGSITGSSESNIMIGDSSAGLFLIDLTTQNIESFNWQSDDTITSITYSLTGDNEYMLILDSAGQLNLFSADNDWQLEKQISIFDSSITTDDSAIIASKSHDLIYIINDKKVIAVDLDSDEITSLFELDFTPGNSVWLGVSQ